MLSIKRLYEIEISLITFLIAAGKSPSSPSKCQTTNAAFNHVINVPTPLWYRSIPPPDMHYISHPLPLFTVINQKALPSTDLRIPEAPPSYQVIVLLPLVPCVAKAQRLTRTWALTVAALFIHMPSIGPQRTLPRPPDAERL